MRKHGLHSVHNNLKKACVRQVVLDKWLPLNFGSSRLLVCSRRRTPAGGPAAATGWPAFAEQGESILCYAMLCYAMLYYIIIYYIIQYYIILHHTITITITSTSTITMSDTSSRESFLAIANITSRERESRLRRGSWARGVGGMSYMSKLLGWLETRLAQITLKYMKLP